MLRERSIGYAVLQALGLERDGVLRIVVLEWIVALAYGLVAGILCGALCARLYVPFFPLSDSSGLPVSPFIAFINWKQAI